VSRHCSSISVIRNQTKSGTHPMERNIEKNIFLPFSHMISFGYAFAFNQIRWISKLVRDHMADESLSPWVFSPISVRKRESLSVIEWNGWSYDRWTIRTNPVVLFAHIALFEVNITISEPSKITHKMNHYFPIRWISVFIYFIQMKLDARMWWSDQKS
jgi:RsiW-degrading membrane proteinase PrsW (M82 family)